MGGFPRFSISGLIVLIVYLLITYSTFACTIYDHALQTGALAASSSSVLNGIIVATGILNVVSHAAVVLGALDDTYVLSILVGVGFDVVTRMIQLVWWMELSWITSRDPSAQTNSAIHEHGHEGTIITITFLVASSGIYIYHMIVHVQALTIKHHTYERATKILRGALNNLQGIAGEVGFEDHLFAYSDLGLHLAPLHLSGLLLYQQQKLVSAVWMLILLIVASALVLSQVPFNKYKKDNEPTIRVVDGKKIVCEC